MDNFEVIDNDLRTSLLLNNKINIEFNRNLMVTKVIMWLQVFHAGKTKIVVKTKTGKVCGTLLIETDQDSIMDPGKY